MYRITGSVGRGGTNLESDVRTVQILLNRQIIAPATLLKVDGLIGPKTIAAIVTYQQRMRLPVCDGRVDPAGRTLQALAAMPKAAPVADSRPFTLDKISKLIRNSGIGNLLTRIQQQSVNPNIKPRPISPPVAHSSGGKAIAWGARVRPEFKKKVIEICAELDVAPDYLMACMALETGESFRPDIYNEEGSGAVGLIQFMPSTAKSMGTTTKKLENMKDVEQLEYVKKFFLWKKGRLKSLEDVYLTIFFPKGVGKDADTPIITKGDIYYDKNSGFDVNPSDGKITPAEISAKVRKVYNKGLSKGYFG